MGLFRDNHWPAKALAEEHGNSGFTELADAVKEMVSRAAT